MGNRGGTVRKPRQSRVGQNSEVQGGGVPKPLVGSWRLWRGTVSYFISTKEHQLNPLYPNRYVKMVVNRPLSVENGCDLAISIIKVIYVWNFDLQRCGV